jgi:hypothetical protein
MSKVYAPKKNNDKLTGKKAHLKAKEGVRNIEEFSKRQPDAGPLVSNTAGGEMPDPTRGPSRTRFHEDIKGSTSRGI